MSVRDIKRSEDSAGVEIPLPGGGAARLSCKVMGECAALTIELPYRGAYGMGERFNGVNQKGKRVVNKVEEKFCFQGEFTYCPMPFFWTDTGFGLYVETGEVTEFDFGERITVRFPKDAGLSVFTGTPSDIIALYQSRFGAAVLPPKWAFGPWISANCWNRRADVDEQLEQLREHGYPATVLVLEAWSDEATFYIFNGAKYRPKAEGDPLRCTDFDYSESQWGDPADMIEKLHEAGVRLILWQIPVYKKQEESEPPCLQNDLDRDDVAVRGLCVMNEDGTPYTIPPGHWFAGSMIPDFTNPATVRAWFAKRQYLLDLGVDGFKTDGGEFIYDPTVRFFDGSRGRHQVSEYARQYTQAYADFIGEGRTLFSRAGYAGAHRTPILWAGDQQSQNSEMAGALSAGLSAAASGVPFWSFDIGGFAGELPTLDLYRRGTQLACFCPVMQWHSELIGGQFREMLAGGKGNNERSPWNLAKAHQAPSFLQELRFWYRLRMNLLPYLYSTARACVEEGTPMMRPLVIDWSGDADAVCVETQYMLGKSLMVAPVLEENAETRRLYLPAGAWVHLFTRERFAGGWHTIPCGDGLPVFIRSGTGLALNLDADKALGGDVGNRTDGYQNLHFLLAGARGRYHFTDDLGSDLTLDWSDGAVQSSGHCPAAFTYEFV